MKAGLTLVEVVIALLVLELGLLGALGLTVLAGRLVAQAELREHAVAWVERVADSLASAGDSVVSTGERIVPGGSVRWSVSDQGWGAASFSTPEGEQLLRVDFLAGR